MHRIIRRLLLIGCLACLLLGMVSMPASAATFPDAPPNLTATAVSYNTVYLDWDPVNGADVYTYEYSTSATSWPDRTQTFQSTTYARISGLAPRTTYYFKVYAWYTDKDGYHHRSAQSAIVSAKPMTQLPKYLSVSSTNYNTLRLVWAMVSYQTGFQVWRQYGLSSPILVADNITVTTYNDIGLTCGMTYSYKLRAYYTVGSTKYYSDYTDLVSGVPVPSVPERPLAYSISYNTLHLNWRPVDGASGYRIERAPTPTGSWSLVTTTAATSFNDTGLTCGSTYYFRVRAYKTMSKTNTVYGDWSDVFSGRPIPAIAFNLAATGATYNSLQLTWSAVSGASGYDIRRATSTSGPWTTISTSVLQPSYTNTGLSTGTTYYYQVRAYRLLRGSERVYGDWSSTASGKSVPAKPTGVSVVSVDSHTLRVTWSSVEGAHGYYIERALKAIGPWSLLDSSVATANYQDSGLTTNMTYFYRLKAYRIVSRLPIYGEMSSPASGIPKETPTIPPGSSPSPSAFPTPSPSASPTPSSFVPTPPEDGTITPTGAEGLSPSPSVFPSVTSSETSSGETTNTPGTSPGSTTAGETDQTNTTTSPMDTNMTSDNGSTSSGLSPIPDGNQDNGGNSFPWVPIIVVVGIVGVGAGTGAVILLRKKR